MARITGAGDAGGTQVVSVALATAIVLSSIVSCAGIQCFKCNSHYDKNCGDPFNNYTSELINCDQEEHRMSHLPLKEDETRYSANICRKTVQIIAEEVRVIRSCGWLPNPESMKDRDCFTRTGTHQVMVYHCVCKGSACNGAQHHTVHMVLVLLGLVTLPGVWRRVL